MVTALITTFALAMSTDTDSLVADLKSTEAEIRATAAEQLCRLEEGAREAALPLVMAAGDDDERVRDWAAAALEELGPPSTADVQSLENALADEHADRAYWAATLLGRLEGKAADSVGSLEKALTEHSVSQVRQRAAWALGKIGPEAGSAIAALQEAATSEDARLARLASRAIEQIQP
jgi:HEAT repeat protein